MDVIIDGAGNFAVQGKPDDVLAVVAAANDHLRAQGRAILSLTTDGDTVLPEDLIEHLQGKPVSEVTVLTIETEEIAAMVEKCLAELRSTLPELPEACRQLAQLFQGDVPEEAYEPFHQLADIWSHVKRRERLVSEALDLDLDALSIDGTPLNAMHQDLNAQLEAALLALEKGDTVLLGDLLEYELAPRAEMETKIVALLQEHAPAKSA